MNLTFAYVALVYALFVAGMRRYDDRLRIGVAVLFYLLVAVFFFESLFGSAVDLPADFLGRMPPWQAVLPQNDTINELTNDIVLQFVPWSHEVREAWKSFSLPLWNESVGGGYPLMANGQSSALSPIRLLAIPIELGKSFSAEAAFKLLIALTFAYLWARRRHLSETASVVVSICFGFSMGLHAWLHFPHATTAAMIPAIFYAVDRLVLDERRSGVALVTVIFAVTLLAGHPETAAHGISFGGFWFFVVLFTERRARWKQAIGRMSLACVFSLLIASPFLLPFLEALPRSLRMEALRHGLDLSIPHRNPELFVMMLHGDFFGRIGHYVWGPVHPEFASAFAGMIAVAGFIALLVRLVVTRRRSSPFAFFVFAIPLTLMAIFAVPPVSTLLEMTPPFSFAANSRLRIVLCWLLAVCAGALIDLVRERRTREPLVGALFVFVAVGTAVIVYGVVGDPQRQATLTTAIPGLLSVAAVFALLGPHWLRRTAPVIVVALVTTDLWLTSRGFNPEVPNNYLYPETPLTVRLQELTAEDPMGPVRFTALGSLMFPNSASIYGLQDIRAHDPMAAGRTLGFMRVLADYDAERYFAMLKRIDHPFLDFMNVRYLVSWDSVHTEGFTEVYSGPDGKISRNDQAQPRFRTAKEIVVAPTRKEMHERLLEPRSWSELAVVERQLPHVVPAESQVLIDVDHRGPGDYRIWLNPPEPRLMITSMPWWPGWRVRSKGETLESVRVNGGFLGFVVPEGPTRIKLTYRPLSFQIGVVLFLIGVAGLVFYLRFKRAAAAPDRDAPGAPRPLLAPMVLVLLVVGCGQSDRAGDAEHFPAYPQAREREEMTKLFKRAHDLMNTPESKDLEVMIFDTSAPVEDVAHWYAHRYALGEVAEDAINDFSAVTPRAYLLTGDLENDFRRIEPLLNRLDVDTDIEGIDRPYEGAHVNAVYGRPRVTLQRPYVDPIRGVVVDRTLILLVHD
ncbi:MAG: YfhO family protein [Acidobacteria bacterium]|nr:YfhO family protein [Acidobacteriota bacterium]